MSRVEAAARAAAETFLAFGPRTSGRFLALCDHWADANGASVDEVYDQAVGLVPDYVRGQWRAPAD